jgi:opacity protein-like surface antigen
MHKLSLILITFLALALSASTLTAQDKITLFGGYSYLRPSLTQTTMFVCSPGTICPAIVTAPLAVNTKPNLNGWEVSATYSVFPWLGMEADFSGHYGTALGDSTAKFHTYVFGPEVRWPARVSPYAHVLFGGAHESTSTGNLSGIALYNTVLSSSETALAFAMGGGVDIKAAPFVSVRPIQVDYLMARFASNTQNQLRVSAGLVLHF